MRKVHIELKISKNDLKKKLNIRDGKDGKNYRLTGKDIQRIAGKIKVPIVEKKVIEKEVIVRDTAAQERDKLESLKKGEKLTINAIEDLPKILEDLINRHDVAIGKGGRSRSNVRFIDDETPSGTVNGVNTIFVLSKTPLKNSLKLYRGGGRVRVVEDYTLSGKTITFLIPVQVGEIVLADYRY